MRMTDNTLKINAYKKMIATHEENISALHEMFGNGILTSSGLRDYGKLSALIERYRAMIEYLGGTVS